MSSLIQVAPAVLLTLCYIVQTDALPNMQQIPLLPYMVAVESGDCDKHLYEFHLCCHSNSYKRKKKECIFGASVGKKGVYHMQCQRFMAVNRLSTKV